MTNQNIATVLIVATLLSKGTAQTKKNPVVGTWRLASVTDTTDKGEVIKDAYGLNPAGLITYTADGRMMVIFTYGGRKLLSIPDRMAAPVGERAEAFATVRAYAGRYTITGDKVIHHIEVDSFQNYVGMDIVRFVRIEGHRMTLRTTPFLRDGMQFATEELVWDRISK